jgi:hypothetical protein
MVPDSPVAMLPQSADKVAGHPDVKRAVGSAGEKVDAGLTHFLHVSEIATKWMLKQVQHDE